MIWFKIMKLFMIFFLFSGFSQLAELRQECEARGLETKGNKGELIARLQAYLDEHGEDVKPHTTVLYL